MNSHNTSTYANGFSLIETSLALALLGVVLISGIYISLGQYTNASHRYTVEMIEGLLVSARSNALTNIHQTPHGLHITSTNLILFEGTTFIPNHPHNIVIPRTDRHTLHGSSTISFKPLSGSLTHADAAISITDNTGHTATITINSVGRIDW